MKSRRSAAIWVAGLALALAPVWAGCSGSTTSNSKTGSDGGGGGMDEASSSNPFADSGLSQGTPACNMCLQAHCLAELTAVAGDPLSVAVSNCSLAMNCTGDCCFCNNDMMCSQTSCTNYGGGPCAAQIEVAAGVPSPSDCITNGKTVGTNCKDPTNSCGKTNVLGQCEETNCKTECSAPTCPPS